MTEKPQRSEDKWTTMRIAPELMAPLEDLVKNATDEFGLPLFKSKSEAVTKAVADFLRENMPKAEPIHKRLWRRVSGRRFGHSV